MKELRLTHDRHGIHVVVEDACARLAISGLGATPADAAGWVLHHLRRHLRETIELFERVGITPTQTPEDA